MFGYVTICKECLTDDEYDDFRAYYCGLCKETGRRCSEVCRMGLSYDITFLALLLSSIETGELKKKQCRCMIHPFKKYSVASDERAIAYAADMGVILTYLKLYDDWCDDKSIKALIAMFGIYSGMRKAKKRGIKQYDTIKRELCRLGDFEKSDGGLDESADCFAKILECLFTPDFVTDKTQRRVLGWLGYNLGRWIYVIDAYNDIEKDFKSHSYNPFLVGECDTPDAVKKRIKDNIRFSLTLNLNELASAFELLKIQKNDGILRNVIYTGLIAEQNKILGE